MNIKKLIVPVGSLIVIIIALIIGVSTINKPNDQNKSRDTTQTPHANTAVQSQLDEADVAYRKGDYPAALTILEKVRTVYQDQNKKNEADTIGDRIESIKALQDKEATNTNDSDKKTAAPIAE